MPSRYAAAMHEAPLRFRPRATPKGRQVDDAARDAVRAGHPSADTDTAGHTRRGRAGAGAHATGRRRAEHADAAGAKRAADAIADGSGTGADESAHAARRRAARRRHAAGIGIGGTSGCGRDAGGSNGGTEARSACGPCRAVALSRTFSPWG